MKYNNIAETIGKTPLVELKGIKKKYNLQSNIYAKVESFNPGGSVKDRAVYYMINKAIEEGKIGNDTTIIEATSGNTGIAIAWISSLYGLKSIIVMPSAMSVERKQIMESYGAKVILSDGGMDNAVMLAKKISSETKNSFILDQFNNPNNVLAHYDSTGKEIYNDLPSVDYLVSAIGTGGTITGTGKFLREKNNMIKIIGVEPFESSVLNGFPKGKHRIAGIGAGFIPSILNQEYIDEILRVKSDDAFDKTRELFTVEGITSGISSGAALFAAIEISKKVEGKNIVVIFPDTSSRYLSTELFNKS